MVFRPDFTDLVIEDAAAIQNREDTDSIQIIDDIRHHLLNGAFPGAQSIYTDTDIDASLDLLDTALKRLGLDA